MEIIYWTGVCDKERVEALTDIEKHIKQFGSLADFKSFSGIAVSFNIEIKDQNMHLLFNELSKYVRMDDFETQKSNDDKQRTVVFNLSFVNK